jgi:DNA polymerase-3 subunit beta
MKIVGRKDHIFEAFRTATRVITQSAGKTIPQEVKLVCTEEGEVQLFATDLERSIRCIAAGEGLEVADAGEVSVPGPKTFSILGALEDENVTLETTSEGGFLHIRSKGSQFKVNTSPVDEFPPFPQPAWEDSISMDAKAFRDMVERTSFATANEKIHFSLHGVFLRLEKKGIRMVGTDGRRLAIANGKVDRSGADLLEMIVPTKGIKMFEEIVGDEDTVSFSCERNQLFLKAGGVEAGTLLIDGKYPEYEKAVPKDNPLDLEIDREAFFSGLRKAAVFAEADQKGVWFKIEPEKLVMFSNAAGSGEAEIEIPAKYEGEPFEIQFNPEFIRAVRKLIDVEKMRIRLRDHKTAAVFHSSEPFTYVVMPIVKK